MFVIKIKEFFEFVYDFFSNLLFIQELRYELVSRYSTSVKSIDAYISVSLVVSGREYAWVNIPFHYSSAMAKIIATNVNQILKKKTSHSLRTWHGVVGV